MGQVVRADLVDIEDAPTDLNDYRFVEDEHLPPTDRERRRDLSISRYATINKLLLDVQQKLATCDTLARLESDPGTRSYMQCMWLIGKEAISFSTSHLRHYQEDRDHAAEG